jgi:hypothetical protein
MLMRTPVVQYEFDDVISGFIKSVAGGSSQDLMIGSEICVAAGLASRQLTLRDGNVIIAVCASAELQSRVKTLGEAMLRDPKRAAA